VEEVQSAIKIQDLWRKQHTGHLGRWRYGCRAVFKHLRDARSVAGKTLCHHVRVGESYPVYLLTGPPDFPTPSGDLFSFADAFLDASAPIGGFTPVGESVPPQISLTRVGQGLDVPRRLTKARSSDVPVPPTVD
jgi:hypothetical protein